MELVQINNNITPVVSADSWHEQSTEKPFIQANTVGCSLEEIRKSHIIPVFIKDNEPVISHHDFIDVTNQVVYDSYPGEQILMPSIR